MRKPVQPSDLDIVIHALYSHACAHQEALIRVGASIAAMRKVLAEHLVDFEATYAAEFDRQASPKSYPAAHAQLRAMKEALDRLRENLGIGSDGNPAGARPQ